MGQTHPGEVMQRWSREVGSLSGNAWGPLELEEEGRTLP